MKNLYFKNSTPENEADCTCMPVKVIEDSLKEGISPYGSLSQECFQVDSKYIFSNQIYNCKTAKSWLHSNKIL